MGERAALLNAAASLQSKAGGGASVPGDGLIYLDSLTVTGLIVGYPLQSSIIDMNVVRVSNRVRILVVVVVVSFSPSFSGSARSFKDTAPSSTFSTVLPPTCVDIMTGHWVSWPSLSTMMASASTAHSTRCKAWIWMLSCVDNARAPLFCHTPGPCHTQS